MVEFEKYDTITVIDFETASSTYYSACALGIVLIKDKAVVDKQYYLIQPPNNYFDKANIDIHGITPEQTAAADTFPTVWEKIKQYFCNTYVAAHNASFDVSVLKSTLDYYGIEQPDFLYMCSIQISGLNIPYGEDVGRTLEARCNYFDVPLCEHHNALCDAEACTGLIMYALEHTRYKTVGTFVKCSANLKQYEDIKLKKTFGLAKFRKIDIKEIAATTAPAAEADADFNGKVFVFTGELKRLTREQAIAKVIAGGGMVKNGVTKKVDVLVNADTVITNKVQAALDLQAAGHRIRIVNDDQFMSMLADNGAIGIDSQNALPKNNEAPTANADVCDCKPNIVPTPENQMPATHYAYASAISTALIANGISTEYLRFAVDRDRLDALCLWQAFRIMICKKCTYIVGFGNAADFIKEYPEAKITQLTSEYRITLTSPADISIYGAALAKKFLTCIETVKINCCYHPSTENHLKEFLNSKNYYKV